MELPARVIKFYWLIEHESKLYPEDKRYTREQIQEIMNKYSNKNV